MAKDRAVALNGRLYEAPVGLIGKAVTLLNHEHDRSRGEVLFSNTSYGFLVPLDLHINCRIRRDHHLTEIDPQDNEKQTAESPDHYRNGQLFGKGDSDDEL